MSPLPYELERWLPLLRGPLPCVAHLGPDGPWDARTLAARVDALTPGAGLFVEEPAPRTGGAAFLRGLVRRGPVERALAVPPPGTRVERFHALPNTGGGFVLVAAEDGDAFRDGLHWLPAGRRRWRVARGLLDLAASGGLRRLPGSWCALVTREDLAGRGGPACRLHGLAGSAPRVAAVAAGVPGPDQKLTLLLHDGPRREVRVLKCAFRPLARQRVRAEARALAWLAERFPGRSLAPALLGAGEACGSDYLVQTRLAGRRSPDALGDPHLAFLGNNLRGTLFRAPLSHVPSQRAARRRFALLAPHADASWARVTGALQAALATYWQGRGVPCALAHGDFAPWNLRVAPDGALRAFDWERWDPAAPALLDLLHFRLQVGVLVRRQAPARILAALERLARGRARSLVESACERPEDLLGLLGLVLFQGLVRDAERDAADPPAYPQAAWLRTTRLALAELVAARLARGSEPPAALPRQRGGDGADGSEIAPVVREERSVA